MRYDNEEWCKVWNWTDLSIQNWYETFNEFSLERSKMSKNCTLMGWLWPKYIRVRVQRRYVLCHSKLIQSLKENWLVLPKIDMRNFANFRQSTWKSTNWDLGVILLSTYELNIYRGVMCHDNEQWCKYGRGIDLSVQNWHEEFDKFWPEHSKISKICTLMGSFWIKHITFELNKYRGVLCYCTEEWYKIWRGNDLSVQNWYKEFDKFWPKHLKISKICTSMGCLQSKIINIIYIKYNFCAKKSIEELRVMALKIDAKFEGKLICAFQKFLIYRLKNSDFILESKRGELSWKQNLLIYFENCHDVPYSHEYE